MENVSAVESIFEARNEVRLVHTNKVSTSRSTGRPSVLGWYRILRAHYQWPLFEAIRYALWLSQRV